MNDVEIPRSVVDAIARKAARKAMREEFAVRRNAGLLVRHRERLARVQTPPTTPTNTEEKPVTVTEITKPRARRSARWTPVEIAVLERMRERYLVRDIAEVLGRSERAVYVVLYRLSEAERTEFCCSRCKVTKPATEFSPGNRWRGARCRDCTREVRTLASAERMRSAGPTTHKSTPRTSSDASRTPATSMPDARPVSAPSGEVYGLHQGEE